MTKMKPTNLSTTVKLRGPGIPHVSDLSASELDNLVALILHHPHEFKFTEKVDGSLNASMYLTKDDAYFTRPSKGQPNLIIDPRAFPQRYEYNKQRFAFGAFKAMFETFGLGSWLTWHGLKDITIEFEVLLGHRPNAIVYGKTCLIPLRILDYTHQSPMANPLTNFKFKKKVWISLITHITTPMAPPFEFDASVKLSSSYVHNEFMVDDEGHPVLCSMPTLKRFEILPIQEYTYLDFIQIFPIDLSMSQDEMVRIFNLGALKLKSNINSSVIAEGLVIHHMTTEKLWKVVNKEHFTRRNNFIWDVRSMVVNGRKKNGTWRPSVHSQLVADIGELLDVKLIKTPMGRKIMRETDSHAYHNMMNRAMANWNVDRIRTACLHRTQQMLEIHEKYLARQKKTNPPYDEYINKYTEQLFRWVAYNFGLMAEILNNDVSRQNVSKFLYILIHI